MDSRGFEKLSISSSAVNLTVPARAQSFLGYLETNDVRIRTDGTDPDATTGTLIKAGSQILLGSEELKTHKFIRVSADATLNGHFYAEPEAVVAALMAGSIL